MFDSQFESRPFQMLWAVLLILVTPPNELPSLTDLQSIHRKFTKKIQAEIPKTIMNSREKKYIVNSLSVSRIHNKPAIHFANTILWSSILWIHYRFCKSTVYSLTFTRIQHEYTIFLTNSVWIHSLVRR